MAYEYYYLLRSDIRILNLFIYFDVRANRCLHLYYKWKGGD